MESQTNYSLPRGAKPSPRQKLAAAAPHQIVGATPANFLMRPNTLSDWGNMVHGDCVTAEEAFAKACYIPEIFIPAQVAVNWAQSNGWLEGAYLTEVLDKMLTDGFQTDGLTYDDGHYNSVDWTNAAVLQNAISLGPVKLGVGADQLDIAYRYNGVSATPSGWFATGFTQAGEQHGEDHCVSLCGYGTLAWLAQQFGVQLPNGINGEGPGYALFTWGSIGIIDQSSMLAITHEAWLRNPTTIIAGQYQKRTLETATTFGNENDGTWQLLPNLDLVFIKTSNTPNGRVEVHIASKSSNYQQRTLETATTFGNENDGIWQLMPNLDLVFIKTSNTPNGRVEVHIASRSSNYQQRTLEIATTFGNENDGTWQLMPNLDLVFIKTSNTPNGHVEVHIASRSSNYQQRTLETATIFVNENDGTWQLIPNLDMVFIKTGNTPSGRVEVHIASRSSNYQQRTLETATTFVNENDGTWQLMPNLDLVFIKTSNTPNGHIEVHIASRY